MDLLVKVEKILDVQTFTSKKDGTECRKYAFVGTQVKDQYPKPICFTCIVDEKWAEFGIVEGGEYAVSFNLSSREYNGRWFTEAACWKATSMYRPQRQQVKDNAPQSTQPQPQMPIEAPQQEDEVPF